MAKKLKKVKSLNELLYLARKDLDYKNLLFKSSANLGGPNDDIEKCYHWLITNANEVGDESGVVDEVNFCIGL